ncbi:MAG TPA: TonB-dependent receptor [Allosphingosinicella sp.]|nr:TonB-dependent receptor [Allosphingosinicella sp.]
MIARISLLSGSALALTLAATPAFAQASGETGPPVVLASADAQAPDVTPAAQPEPDEGAIVVTARRRNESLQEVPLAVSVIGDEEIARTGSYNVGRLTQLQPSLQFYTSNPRNSAINIRGIGAPFGLTNDGIEQGVGLYIDQVYYNRVASATLDFVDIERIEVLRGPQGTLYGKNTTAGAINVTTRRPSFEFEGQGEVSIGNLGFHQAKLSVSGPLASNLAARISLSTTDRRGTIYNVATDQWLQSQDNLGLRGQLLWRATPNLSITLSGDFNVQDPVCCAQIYARVAPTQRPLNRQYAALTAAFGYAPPSTDPFDRLTDVDAQLSARNEVGGASLLAEWNIGGGTLTSVTAWRYWDWQPANDRDFTGLPITIRSQNPTKQEQYTQELRYAWASDRFDFVVGAFGFYQEIRTTGTEEQGLAASRWTLAPTSPLSNNPAVLNGLVANNDIRLDNTSLAVFGRVNWNITDRLTISPGIRVNYDKKEGSYSSVVTGTASDGTRQLVLFTGPYASDPWIVAQRGVRAPQFFEPSFSDWNLSYDLTLSYDLARDVMAYATYARTFKSGGVNLNGVPADAAGVPILAAGTVRPETVDHFELGLKTQFWNRRVTLNLTGFWTNIDDFQANVTNGQFGVLRGYLANAEQVRVRGIELELSARPSDRFTFYFNGAFTDHEYVRFVDAPCPPELSGGGTGTPVAAPGVPGNSPANCDISGQWLPGISRWAASYGAEYNIPARFLGREGQVFVGVDGSYRSKFSSNASRSPYTDIDGYSLANFRLGYRTGDFSIFGWVRNAFDEEYFEQLAVTSGNTGLIAGQPGDPRTWGATLRFGF